MGLVVLFHAVSVVVYHLPILRHADLDAIILFFVIMMMSFVSIFIGFNLILLRESGRIGFISIASLAVALQYSQHHIVDSLGTIEVIVVFICILLQEPYQRVFMPENSPSKKSYSIMNTPSWSLVLIVIIILYSVLSIFGIDMEQLIYL
jgi:hypothetical protein